MKSDRALSPVIAAIILIAVTVTASIIAAVWMGALTFSFVRDEGLSVTSHQWAWDCSYIDLTVKNIRTSEATIAEISVNNERITNIVYVSGNASLASGESATLRIFSTFTYGSKYEFLIITQTGNRFFYQAEAPATSSTNIPPGTETLRPNLAGTYQQWETFGGTLRYALTSDRLDGTGVQITGLTTLMETANLADTHVDLGAINSVTAYVRAKATSTETELTRAFIAYRSNSTNDLDVPKSRIWNNAVWSSQNVLASAGSPVRQVRSAVSPIADRSEEKIIVTLSDDGYLDAYVWNGTSWSVTNNIGSVGTTVAAYKSFDIAYETTSGEALLVYSVNSTSTTRDLAYKTWIYGTGWSAEQYIDDTGHTNNVQYRYVAFASNPTSGSNEITMVAVDATNSDASGWVWSGSAWGAIQSLTETVAITTEECIAVAYETQSGRAWTAAGNLTGNFYYMRSQTAGAWNTTTESPVVGGVPNWASLKADPASNKLLLVSVDASSDLNIVYYTGSGAWTVNAGSFAEDAAVDSQAARCADFAWEPTGGIGLIVWGTATNSLSARKFTSATPAWSTVTPSGSIAGTHPWVQLKTNTRSVSGDMRILGATLNSNFDLGAMRWDGTTLTFIGNDVFTADTTVSTYECFELEFETIAQPEKAVILWRTHNVDYESAAFTISRTVFTDYSETRTTNSYTGLPWTWDKINALEIGCIASTLGPDETMQVSEFWIIVDYAGTGD